MRSACLFGVLVVAIYSCSGDGGGSTGTPSSSSGDSGGTPSAGGQAGDTNGSGASAGNAGGGGGEAGATSAGGQGGAGGNGQGGQGGQPLGGQGGQGGGALGDPCNYGANTCDPGLYCDALGCGAGTCELPLLASAQTKEFAPVCGCNGITFYNQSIADSKSAAVSHAGECTTIEGVACNKINMQCAAGFYCNTHVALVADCPPNPNVAVPGFCWGVPIACNPLGPQARGCLGACADTCSLIQSQNAWYEDVTCP